MQGTSPVPPMQTGGLSPAAITAWGRSVGLQIRKSGERYQNEYTYDRMNRLVGAVQDGQEEKYAYDPVGNRLKKESVQGTEIYHYNAKN